MNTNKVQPTSSKGFQHFVQFEMLFSVYLYMELCNKHIGFAKWRVQCFYDSFVQDSSSVFQMNICAENPPLRKAETVTGKRKKTLQTDNGDDKMVILKSIQN